MSRDGYWEGEEFCDERRNVNWWRLSQDGEISKYSGKKREKEGNS
jgi:hypothetical protein